jgi:hypothetical protein
MPSECKWLQFLRETGGTNVITKGISNFNQESFSDSKRRGNDPLNYTTLTDLKNVIRNTWPRLKPNVGSVEWAASIFDVIERSRNVIMHSGVLEKEDVQRLGINIRDWVKQVGA